MSALSLSWGPQLPCGDFSPQGNPQEPGSGSWNPAAPRHGVSKTTFSALCPAPCTLPPGSKRCIFPLSITCFQDATSAAAAQKKAGHSWSPAPTMLPVGWKTVHLVWMR